MEVTVISTKHSLRFFLKSPVRINHIVEVFETPKNINH